MIHHLQLGVWSFLASPAQGLKESTQGGGLNLPRLVDGFVEGSRSLASNVVLAVSTATAKTTDAARKGLINLGLDKLEVTGQLASQEHCAAFLLMLRCGSAIQVFQESASLLEGTQVFWKTSDKNVNSTMSTQQCQLNNVNSTTSTRNVIHSLQTHKHPLAVQHPASEMLTAPTSSHVHRLSLSSSHSCIKLSI